jgi:uncharacterized protein involved in response to NO
VPKPSSLALLGRGFRPFFLLASVLAVVTIPIWVLLFTGTIGPFKLLPDPLLWHAHEMIYGFAMAVIAGFLLTAVANWTGWAPVRGLHLLALVLVWLAGRIIVFIPLIPTWLAIGVQLAFIPFLVVSLFVPLYKSRNIRNYVFLALLFLLFALEWLFLVIVDLRILHLSVLLVMAIISLVGGRIIPAFTVSALRQRGQNVKNTDQPIADRLTLLSWLILAALIYVYGTNSLWVAGAALFAAALLALRMRYYHTLKALCDPLLWILHAAYLWLIIGLILLAAVALDLIASGPVWHAFTVGALGSAVIGMMARVALGHTGRPLVCAPMTVLSFYLIQIAALSRTFGIIAWPDHYTLWLSLSAATWTLAFLLYLFDYAPILCRSRPDGQPA